MLQINKRRQTEVSTRVGAVTVEFAITATIFFSMVFASLEFSRYFYVKHGIEMVAYESARAGVVPGADYSTVETRVQELLAASGIPNATYTILPSEITTQTREVTVTIEAVFSDNSWLPPTFLTNETLLNTCTLQHENVAYLDPEDNDITEVIGDNNDEPIDL